MIAPTELVARLCRKVGVRDPVRAEVLELLHSYLPRYFGNAHPRDHAASFLFWLEKGVGPVTHTFRAPIVHFPQEKVESPIFPPGGLDPRCGITLVAWPTARGVSVQISGWCLANTELPWVCVVLDEEVRPTPVWRPREDVQRIFNDYGLYSPWTCLCCGLEDTLMFERIDPAAGGALLIVGAVLPDREIMVLAPQERIRWGQEINIRL